MKTLVKFILIILVCSTQFSAIAQTQSHFYKDIEALKNPMIIYFENGMIFQGIGHIIDNDVYFTRKGTKTTRKYNEKSIDALDMQENGNVVRFEYRFTNENTTQEQLFRKVSSGKINVYLQSVSTKTRQKNTNPNATLRIDALPISARNQFRYKRKTFNPYLFLDTDFYYIESEDKLIKLAPDEENFIKKDTELTTRYFMNCPDLAKEIQANHYPKYAIVRAIDFYNNSCN